MDAAGSQQYLSAIHQESTFFDEVNDTYVLIIIMTEYEISMKLVAQHLCPHNDVHLCTIEKGCLMGMGGVHRKDGC